MFSSLISKSIDIFILILASISIRFGLEYLKQNWIKTFSQTATLIFLPIITYTITSVISGNIALSLGMVGALSIVRFRNPVRSSFELTTYFASVTLGIAAAADIKWLLFFLYSLLVASFLIIIITKIAKIFKREIFVNSFTEGDYLSTLEINTKKEIEFLEYNENIQSIRKLDNQFTYLLASKDFKKLKQIIIRLKDNLDVKDYQLNK